MLGGLFGVSFGFAVCSMVVADPAPRVPNFRVDLGDVSPFAMELAVFLRPGGSVYRVHHDEITAVKLDGDGLGH